MEHDLEAGQCFAFQIKSNPADCSVRTKADSIGLAEGINAVDLALDHPMKAMVGIWSGVLQFKRTESRRSH